jgi:hypothetical protein
MRSFGRSIYYVIVRQSIEVLTNTGRLFIECQPQRIGNLSNLDLYFAFVIRGPE